MHYYEVAPTSIIRQTSATFTYHSPEGIPLGSFVKIEIGSRQLQGVVIEKVNKPTYTTKPITSLLPLPSLPTELIQLAQWMSSYYGTHLALVLQTLLPRGLDKKRRAPSATLEVVKRKRTNFLLNEAQQTALASIATMTPGTALLHGVTGSGKTVVYIEAAKATMKEGKSVIILVPEIALTSQLVAEFAHHFSDILLTHSRQSEAERHLVWQEALESTHPRLVIGPRSALFMPVRNLGLIVIDEAHEPSFKQEQSPRYSALRAASILASLYNGKVILGSATPLVTDYYLAEHTKRPIIHLPKRAQEGAIPASIQLVDMTKRTHFKHHRFLSDELIAHIDSTFQSGHQVLLFHNRRGSASSTLCENCGWQALCPRCFVPLTLHADTHQLRCHICNHTERVPTSCPICQYASIIHKGIGTKLIESELRKLYPNKRIQRFDGDNDAQSSVEQLYSQLYDGTIDLIIGTQVIAKGLDLPHLRTVGVVQADSGLSLPDYGAPERTFELLAQVIGRVGRNEHPTTVIIQSYQPTHPAIVDGLAQDYAHFYQTTLAERERAHFPPFTYLLKLTNVYKSEATAISHAQKLAHILRTKGSSAIELLGPTPAFYERQRDTYRWQIIVKSSSRHHLHELLAYVPPTHWQFEFDPISLL